MAATASIPSVNYLEGIWAQRSEGAFDRALFEAMSQTDVSAHIDRLLKRKELPATEAQLAEIAELAGQIDLVVSETGEVKHPTFDPKIGTGAADRVISKLRRDVRIKNYAEAKQFADVHLDELLDTVEVL